MCILKPLNLKDYKFKHIKYKKLHFHSFHIIRGFRTRTKSRQQATKEIASKIGVGVYKQGGKDLIVNTGGVAREKVKYAEINKELQNLPTLPKKIDFKQNRKLVNFNRDIKLISEHTIQYR